MLGLDDEVDGDERGRRSGTGHDDDLGGAGEGRRHAYNPADLAFRLGDVGIAGAGDDVDPGDGGGPVGHGPDRLGAADPVDLADAGDGGRRQRGVVDLAVARRRHAERDAPTPATRAGAAHMRTVGGIEPARPARRCRPVPPGVPGAPR